MSPEQVKRENIAAHNRENPLLGVGVHAKPLGMTARISIEKYALELAKTAALRSEDPYKKVGACALNHENRVIGLAYNGLASGSVVTNEFWRNREDRLPFMLHAEVNLCSLFTRGHAKIVATTLLPCSSCARMLAAYGVKTVLYAETYKRDEGAFDIFKFYGVSVKHLEDL